jgi:hypothetical protein
VTTDTKKEEEEKDSVVAVEAAAEAAVVAMEAINKAQAVGSRQGPMYPT